MKSQSNLILLLTAALVIIAGFYFWRKNAAAGKHVCREICYSTSPEPINGDSCDVICVPPAKPAA